MTSKYWKPRFVDCMIKQKWKLLIKQDNNDCTLNRYISFITLLFLIIKFFIQANNDKILFPDVGVLNSISLFIDLN